MKFTLFVLLFITSSVFGQTWSAVKSNDGPDQSHEKYPAYVEIDTLLIKNLDEVLVSFNSKSITREGNRFYLSTKPFVDKTNLSIKLTKKGESDLNKNRTNSKVYINSKDFNKIHAMDFYKIQTKKDSLILGEEYDAFIVIDSTKIEKSVNLKIVFNDYPIVGDHNKYRIMARPTVLGPNPFDITIFKTEKGHSETIKVTIYTFAILPPSSKKQ